MEYAKLATEKINPRTLLIDSFKIPQIIEAISEEDRAVAYAVYKTRQSIYKAVQIIVEALRKKNRLFFVGAGTSGRLGVIEAAECPPTFYTEPWQIQAIMAGGKKAVFQSQEGAEDDASAGKKEIKKRIKKGDVVAGIAASGVTPFVLASLQTAHQMGCPTILITCNTRWKSRLKNFHADVVIALNTGPEVIAGSTRMKAGTATKMVLNMLTTASMIQLGKIYGNRMVDLQMKSRKLHERAIGILMELTALSRKDAVQYLHLAQGRVKPAIVMAKKNISYKEAMELLEKNQGFLRKALGVPP